MNRSRKDKASNALTKPDVSASRQRSGKTPRKIHWVRYGVIFVLLATCAVIVGVNGYSRCTIEKEHAEVARQLNEVATDLHKVYVNLKSTLPNVVWSNFQNECSMSYAGPFSKAYSCGPAIYLYKQNAEDSIIARTDEVLVLEQKFTHARGLQTGVSNAGGEKYSHSVFLFDSISTKLICHGYSYIYTDVTTLERRTGKVFAESSLPVESIGIYCPKNLTYPVDLENSWAQ